MRHGDTLTQSTRTINTAAELIQALDGDKYGMCRCPAHDDSRPSLSVSQGNVGVLVRCHAGCEQRAVLDALKARGIRLGSTNRRIPDEFKSNEYEAKRRDAERLRDAIAIIRAAHGQWNEPKPDRSLLAKYFNGRGITSVPDNAMLLTGKAAARLTGGRDADGDHVPGKRFPAVVFAVGGPKGLQGCQITYLNNDGDKLPCKVPRKSYGPLSGGYVQFGLIDETKPILIGEGIETTLAAMQISGCQGIATLGTSGMQALENPPDASEYVIVADNDEPGKKAANALATYLANRGKAVRVAIPPLLRGETKTDWNDILQSDADLDKMQRRILSGKVVERTQSIDTKRKNDAMPRSGQAYTVSELLAMELPPLKWIVKGMLPEGLSLLVGKPKLGKSWLALQTALAVIYGRGVFPDTEGFECRQGEVLYLALEDGLRRMTRRLKKLNATPSDRLTFRFDWPNADDGGIEKLRQWLTEHPSCRLVVIDTLKKFRPKLVAGDQLYDYDYRAGEALQKLSMEFGIAVVVVHHARKSAADDPLDMVSGTTGLTAGVDQAIVLHRVQRECELYMEGRDIEQRKLAVSFHKASCTWLMMGDAEEYHQSDRQRQILDCLAEAGEGGMTAKELADACEVREGAMRTALSRMTRKGQVTTKSRGRYGLVEKEPPNVTDAANVTDDV